MHTIFRGGVLTVTHSHVLGTTLLHLRKDRPGIAAAIFGSLPEAGVNINVITTSEVKISVLIDRKYKELAVQALHDAFGLEKAA